MVTLAPGVSFLLLKGASAVTGLPGPGGALLMSPTPQAICAPLPPTPAKTPPRPRAPLAASPRVGLPGLSSPPDDEGAFSGREVYEAKAGA